MFRSLASPLYSDPLNCPTYGWNLWAVTIFVLVATKLILTGHQRRLHILIFNKNHHSSNVFVQENASDVDICRMAAILVREQFCLSVFQWWQATGLDAWASRVKCPARFVSHLHEICIYIYELFIAFVFLLFVHYCNLMVCVVYWVGKWRSRGSTGMFGNLMAIYHIMLQFIQIHYKSTFS